MKKIFLKVSFLTLFLILLPGKNSFGNWAGPAEVVSGSWGNGDNQFGLKTGDTVTYDSFPQQIIILPTNKIIIHDEVNRRSLLYHNSTFQEKVNWVRKNLPDGKWTYDIDKYAIFGNQVGFSGDNIWIESGGGYGLYSPTGTSISTSTTRPLELGQVTEKRIGKTEYQITVKYPDKEWVIISDKSIGYGVAHPFRDANGKLYLIYSKKVERYDDKGKVIGTLSMPEVQYGAVTIPPDWPDNAEPPRARVVAEHGSPVVAPNGDVYTWMRSDTHYKILKWTWQD